MNRAVLMVSIVIAMVLAPPLLAADKQPGIDWQEGPTTGDLGAAQLEVPQGFKFTGRNGAQRVLELTHNPASGKEVGVLIPVIPESATDKKLWIMFFEFDEIGFVKDEEKDQLDADALLKSISEATEEQNKLRKQKGWAPFHIISWYKPPFYDPQTHNLTWAILGKDDQGEQAVNYSTRILGRRGTMNVDLVLDPQSVSDVVPQFNSLIGAFQYKSGNKYAEFMKGDKVAEYGLVALIAGGTGAALVKSGVLLKFWKLIVAGFIALAAMLKRIWARMRSLFSTEEKPATLPPTNM